jgi:hypothetical protein
MLAVVNTAGLMLSLIGVFLLFRYGMPYRVRTDGKTEKTVKLADADEKSRLEKRYDRLGKFGLFLIVVGTVCQIYVGIVTLCPSLR